MIARRAPFKDNGDVPMLTPSEENTVQIVTTLDGELILNFNFFRSVT